ncbi:MAG TPA: ComF family protein [Thermoanaerobaculia bacterium]|nr:ComF family protein [Thermoanaerobaculia bacterium]
MYGRRRPGAEGELDLIALARAAARFVFPSECLACGTRDAHDFFRGGVCARCWDALPSPESERCVRCDETLPGGTGADACGRCLLDPPAFAALRSAAPYRGPARDILLAFKFRGADYLAPRMADAMRRRLGVPEADEVAAVPATPRARRARGYHPAEALAAAAARGLGIAFARGRLVKTRDTEVQSRLALSERVRNVRRAYAVRGRPARRVLLVDDVATSGATARECARRLADAGAESVIVWCFARASRVEHPGEHQVSPQARPKDEHEATSSFSGESA